MEMDEDGEKMNKVRLEGRAFMKASATKLQEERRDEYEG